MDIASLAGVIIGVVLLAATVATGKGATFAAFADVSAILLVAGGTLACVLICFPLATVLNSVRVCTRVFFNRRQDYAELIAQIISLAGVARRKGLLALDQQLDKIDDPFLALALQMAIDGTRPEVVEDVLRTQMDAVAARHRNGKLVLERMGRFSPALGMIGTLVGLIMMLGNMSSPDAIAPAMAVAMIATFYGVLFANLFCLPFAEKLSFLSRHELMGMEIIVRGVLAIQSGDNPRVIEQRLNTFLPLRRDRTRTARQENLRLIDRQLSTPAPSPQASSLRKVA